MVLFEVDSNNILIEAMKSWTAGNMILAYQTLIDRLKEKGIQPMMHVLDNECSAEVTMAIKRNGMKYQHVPPHDYRRNIAEKAIQFSRIILSQYCVARTRTSRCNCGAKYCDTRSTNSTFCESQG